MKTLHTGPLLLLLFLVSLGNRVQAEDSTYSERQLENAEQELFNALQLPWYELELIVIERLSVLAFNTREQIIERSTPTITRNAALLIDGQTDSSQTKLDLSAPLGSWRDDTRHCFGFGLFEHAAGTQARQFSDPQRDREIDANEVMQPRPATAPNSPDEPAVNQLRAALVKFEQQLIDRSLIPQKTLKLTRNVKLINRRRNLRPLLHLGWLQPAAPRTDPQPMMVQYQEASLPAKLSGSVALTRGRYLHLNVDLWYTTPGLGWQPQPLLGNRLLSGLSVDDRQYMRLNQARRMRSGELHYLDHPKLGVIAQALPVKIPAALVLQYLDMGRPKL